MKKISKSQEQIKNRLDSHSTLKEWRDWKWQIKNSIKDIDTVERILNIKFEPGKKKELEETIKQFPLSVTPYYLSLIDTSDYEKTRFSSSLYPILPRYSLKDAI